MAKNFAITGVAGYIAPRHLKAIHDIGGNLVAAVDPHDAVGVLDKYFPQTSFFMEFERFDRHLEKLRRKEPNAKIDYLSICSPNYLHDAHIRLALRTDADAICEKPLVLNPWNLDALAELEREYGKKVYTILQLRAHPAIIELKQKYSQAKQRNKIELTYITSRGNWYQTSWKGKIDRSGGLASNIGIHFFDMLGWIFGSARSTQVHYSNNQTMSGFLELEKADVTWFLSIDANNLPEQIRSKGQTTFRSILIDGHEVEFSEGFTELHTVVYKNILDGKGYGIEDARASIEMAYQIRNAEAKTAGEFSHPLLQKVIKSK